MDPRKEAICNALATFIRQRPGFEYGNYGDAASYRADVRSVGRDKQHAETLLAAVRWRDSITADDMLKAAQAGGRLTIELRASDGANPNLPNDAPLPVGGVWIGEVDYCTGQYWCTEYRAGVARYLASLLWDWTRDHAMPAPISWQVEVPAADGGSDYKVVSFEPTTAQLARIGRRARISGRLYPGNLSAGSWLRAHFRKEFGSAIQRRWFN